MKLHDLTSTPIPYAAKSGCCKIVAHPSDSSKRLHQHVEDGLVLFQEVITATQAQGRKSRLETNKASIEAKDLPNDLVTPLANDIAAISA